MIRGQDGMIERFFQIYQALGVRDLVEISLLAALIYVLLRLWSPLLPPETPEH